MLLKIRSNVNARAWWETTPPAVENVSRPPVVPDEIRRQIAAVVDSALLQPCESPEVVSISAGFRLNGLLDVVIAQSVVDALAAQRRALQPPLVEQSLSELLASVADTF